MKIIVSAGGRFHAINLAGHLAQRGHLEKLFTFSASRQDHALIPKKKIARIWQGSFLDTMFQRLRLGRVVDKTMFNFYKDTLFDYCVARQLDSFAGMTGEFDIFVVWANYGLRSIPVARKRGALVIVESGSAHIKEQYELLTHEYKKYGLSTHPVDQRTIKRVTQEYELADYITVPSTFVFNSFIKHGIPAEKLLTVPCGMNLAPFLASARILRQAQDERELLSVHGEPVEPHERFRVIFVGLLCLRKGIHYLIDAWNNLDLPEDSSELVLVGHLQADLAHVLKRKKLKKNIIFYGSTDQATLKNLYAESSVFVLPSIEDGFGMVMGEAMASGLPVICTTHTAAHDLVSEGKTGFVIPPGDAGALADKLRWCYEHQDESAQMGHKGRQAIQEHAHTRYSDTITQLYQELLAHRLSFVGPYGSRRHSKAPFVARSEQREHLESMNDEKCLLTTNEPNDRETRP
ncbi:MAG: glycosyltransferase family 4 protein [Candidatus Babeliales bacterium]